jgi:hypothetical protein
MGFALSFDFGGVSTSLYNDPSVRLDEVMSSFSVKVLSPD